MHLFQELLRRLHAESYVLTELQDGTAVLLHGEVLEVITLNSSGAYIVRLMLDRSNLTRDECAASVSSEFDVDPATASADVDAFTERLAAAIDGRE